MKKLLVALLIILLCNGCRLVYVERQSYKEIVEEILRDESNLKNVSVSGYSYYLPRGVILKSNRKLNSILYYNHNKMYLYVDIVAYYHQTSSKFIVNHNGYYSYEIKMGNNFGYLEITELDDKYFVEYMYNYAKIESYVSYNDLKRTLTQMSHILNSMKYNNAVISTKIGENALDYNEESFNIFKPTKEEGSTLQAEEENTWKDEPIEDEQSLNYLESLE